MKKEKRNNVFAPWPRNSISTDLSSLQLFSLKTKKKTLNYRELMTTRVGGGERDARK